MNRRSRFVRCGSCGNYLLRHDEPTRCGPCDTPTGVEYDDEGREVVRRNARGQVVWMASSNTHRALWGSEKGRAVPSRDWSVDNPPEATRIGEL